MLCRQLSRAHLWHRRCSPSGNRLVRRHISCPACCPSLLPPAAPCSALQRAHTHTTLPPQLPINLCTHVCLPLDKHSNTAPARSAARHNSVHVFLQAVFFSQSLMAALGEAQVSTAIKTWKERAAQTFSVTRPHCSRSTPDAAAVALNRTCCVVVHDHGLHLQPILQLDQQLGGVPTGCLLALQHLQP